MQSVRSVTVFQKILLPPSPGVNNHPPHWWCQQNPLTCWYTSSRLHNVKRPKTRVFIHMHARVRNQKYVSIYKAVFRIVLSATLRVMKLLSCFTRSRDQMMWSWSACIWAAASAADSGYTTVVHPNPVHRQDMTLLSRKHSLHEGRKNNFKPS